MKKGIDGKKPTYWTHQNNRMLQNSICDWIELIIISQRSSKLKLSVPIKKLITYKKISLHQSKKRLIEYFSFGRWRIYITTFLNKLHFELDKKIINFTQQNAILFNNKIIKKKSFIRIDNMFQLTSRVLR